MQVIVCGAGQVGSTIARHLASEGNDVTVVDIAPEQARRIDESHDVRGMVGHAAHPEVLERAGAKDADMLIAVTRSDEVNMVACEVGYSLFNVRRRIARVRHHGYLAPIWSGLYGCDRMPIDVLISPETEIATGIARRLRTPGAFDTVSLVDGRVQLLGIHCNTEACAVVGKHLSDLPQLLPDHGFVVVAVVREGKAFVPSGRDVIEADDDLYLITEPRRADRVMAFLGHKERPAQRIVIVGGGNVGLTLAKELARNAPALEIKLIEHDRERAEFVSGELGDGALVLHGDALDKDVLRDASVDAADTIVAVTNDDETNIFASVLAKREGCGRAITLVNKSSYEPILPALGIDAVVSPNAVTISTILRHVRPRSVSALYTLREDFGEVIEATAQRGSRLVRGNLREIGMPEGMLIGAIVRDGEVVIARGTSRIEPGDRVVALVTWAGLHDAEALMAGVPESTPA